MDLYIKKISGREVLDSRGNPTVEAEIYLSNNIVGRGIVPSGASTGIKEALELKDDDLNRFNGLGVLKAINNINTKINDHFTNYLINDVFSFDKALIELDNTTNKKSLGANAILAVSLAFYNALAKSYQIPLFILFGGIFTFNMPIPMLNILNGGMHANNALDVQEFMIVPISFPSFKKALQASVEVYQQLKIILSESKMSTSVGDEGGFAPLLNSTTDALDLLIKAIKKASYLPKKDFMIALDIASSEWKVKDQDLYILPKSKKQYSSEQLISYYEKLIVKYPILSIEDGLAEDDYQGWILMSKRLKKKVLLVGDDMFVSHSSYLKHGIDKNYANAILIKPNQVGTIYETLNCIFLAKRNNYKVIVSHRSGDSEDTFIASLAVGVQADFVKFGAPCRAERTAKYNELLRIEEKLSK